MREATSRKAAAIGQSRRSAWGEVMPVYALPIEVRRLLDTTDAIAALNAKPRRPRQEKLPYR